MRSFLTALTFLLGLTAIAQIPATEEERAFAMRIYQLQNSDDEKGFYQAEQEFMDYLAEKGDWGKYYNTWMNKIIYDINHQHYYRSYKGIGELTDDISKRGLDKYQYIPNHALGIYYVNRGHAKMGEHYFLKALETVDTAENKLATANLYLSLAQSLSYTNPEKALGYLDLLTSFQGNVPSESGVLGYRCIITYEKGDLEAFDRYFAQYDSLQRNFPDQFAEMNYAEVMVYRFLRQEDYPTALAWCDSLQSANDAANMRMKVYKQMGDWKQAFYEMEKLDSIDLESRNEVMEEELNELVHQIESLEYAQYRSKVRIQQFIIAIIIAIVAFFVVAGMLVYRRRNHKKLMQQYEQLQEARQRTKEALAIRRAFALSMQERLKLPLNNLLGYARIFNNPDFNLTDEQREKSYPDIVNSAQQVETLLEPALNSYMHDKGSISNEQRQLCQDAIRSPLQALIGMAQLIVDDKNHLIPEADYRQMRSEIAASAAQVANATREFLLFSIADDETPIEMNDSVGLNEVVKSALDDFHLSNRALTKRFHTSVSDQVTIMTHQVNMQTVLNCLLSNANKYGTKGDVEVEVSETTSGAYSISVTNQGPAIPASQAEIIFTPFVRLDKSKRGLGLGLSLARRLATSLGYEVRLDTSHAGGTRFVFEGIS